MKVIPKDLNATVEAQRDMADRTCPKCMKVFSAPCRMRQHLKRKTPCDAIVENPSSAQTNATKKHVCGFCSRQFATQPGLSRHIHKACRSAKKNAETTSALLGEQVRELQEKVDGLCLRPATVTNHVSNTVTTTQVRQMVNNVVAIGWPPKWGRVPEGVMPFYLNSLPKLTDKHMAAAEDQRRQTGPEDGQIASLIVELTRTLREDIRNRNVFVSPNRADQALIKLTERWEHIPMDQAKRELMEHVATRIKELDDTAFPQSNEVAGVISRGSRELVQEVSRSLSALLQWRPDVQKLVPDEAGIETPAERGAVTRLYEDGPRDALKLCQLDMDTVVHNLETAAGVWNAEDLQSLEISEVAITVVITMAALVQQRQNDNLHMVLISSEHPALRYSFHEGWVERPAVELAAHLSSQMASVASNRIMGLKRKKEAAGLRAVQAPLESVAVFLREQLGAYDGEETTPGSWFYEPWALRVLARFSRAAVQRCTLETPGYQALRRILSRALSVDCFGETEDILALASAHREALEKAAASSAISLQAKEKT